MTNDESVAQRIAYLQEIEEARFLGDFHQTERRPDKNLGMIGILRPRYFHKGIRCSYMTDNIRKI
jgi:hypothetical protein